MIRQLASGNLYEYFVIALISVGLPLIGQMYVDWRAALSIFIVVNIILGLLVLKGND